ncbi:PepSY domain-containing protein [Flavobacterium sp. 140616W15]|uniref:PepSY domain-containing protein n=1 Tax=Flavobacterium sp. 140616W15 TaxID=2478552 RepID=UPI001F5C3429|nr:PepSY-associated TM helix domain-containing protein [Flavobacterium sp. 140616W15]
MNYDIHVGAVLGITGKILAFFASLISASLPITGFLIWWGKQKFSKKGTTPKPKVATKAILAPKKLEEEMSY